MGDDRGTCYCQWCWESWETAPARKKNMMRTSGRKKRRTPPKRKRRRKTRQTIQTPSGVRKMMIGAKTKIMEKRKRRRKRRKRKRNPGRMKMRSGKRKVSRPGMKGGTNHGTLGETSPGDKRRQMIGGRRANLLEK